MRTAIIVQARMGSTRLPGKVLKTIANGHSVLDYVLKRVRSNRMVSNIILATSTSVQDEVLAEWAKRREVEVFRGSENDVLGRYLEAAKGYDAVVRVTADCPLVEPSLIDEVVHCGLNSPFDYVTTEGYPRGIGDIEMVTVSALEKAKMLSQGNDYYHEHVTTFVAEHQGLFRSAILFAPDHLRRPDLRVCIDELADLDVVRLLCEHFYPRYDFNVGNVVAYFENHPQVSNLNKHVHQKTR